MRSQGRARGMLALVGWAAAAAVRAQEPAPPTLPPAEEESRRESAALRPIEGNVIINLPSVDVPKEGTLTLIFTHRFQQPVQESNVHDLWSFDSGADIGIGLGYSLWKNFEVSFYRSSYLHLGIYELAGKYHLLKAGPFGLTARVGDAIRTAEDLPDRASFFVQAIASLQIGPRVRITAVPTYVAKTAGQAGYFTRAPDESLIVVSPEPEYRDLFNVPVAATIALTRSITVHGEVIPSYRRTVQITQTCSTPPCPAFSEKNSPGVGWSVSIEKTVLRHRFAFTAGNQRETTVDQYMISNFGGNARNIRLGFNLVRQWKLN